MNISDGMDLQRELRKKVKKGKAKILQGYFKESQPFLGVMVPQIREIAKEYYCENKCRKPKEVFVAAEKLFKGRYHEEKNLALFILQEYDKHFDVLPFLERHLDYLDNWDYTDFFASDTVGWRLIGDRSLLKKLYKWAKSKNLWTRRVAVVSTIRLIKKKHDIGPTMKICEMLAKDEEIMVQKGYAWMLKEAATIDLRRVVKFLKDHNSPRLVVNIAKEKMPESVKRKL